MHSTMMDGLMHWSGLILDQMTFQVPEDVEDAVYATAIELVLHSVAIDPWTMIGDNDH